jgi:hypothetical protein
MFLYEKIIIIEKLNMAKNYLNSVKHVYTIYQVLAEEGFNKKYSPL